MQKLVVLSLAALLGLAPVAASADTPEELIAAASALFDAKRFKDAAPKLEQFLGSYSTNEKAGKAALVLGRCYSELQQYPKAIPAYEKAIASNDPSVLLSARLGLGEAAVAAEQFAKAPPALEPALKSALKPEQEALVRFWLGQAYFELKKYPEAEASYDKVVKDFGKSDFADSAAFGAGLAALRQGKSDAARVKLQVFVQQYPKSEDRVQAFLVLADLDFEAKRFKEARAGYEQVLKEAKSAPEIEKSAEDGLVRTMLELGDHQGAAPHLDSALAKTPATDPQHFFIALSLGHCRYHLKQYDQALAAYTEAAKAKDEATASEGLYWAGNSALNAGKAADAAGMFAKVVATYPKSPLAPKAQLRSGDAFVTAKQTDQAVMAYKAVVDQYPSAPQAVEAKKALIDLVDSITDPTKLAMAINSLPAGERAPSQIRLARMHLEAKRYAEALAPLSDLLKSNPANDVAGEANYLTGIAQEAQQKTAPAVEAYEAVVKLTPNASWVGEIQARLAWLYLDLKKPADAERAGLAVLAGKPDAQAERQTRLALVQACGEQQKWDQVLENCKIVLAGNPPAETAVNLIYTQAWATEKKGQPEDALPYWERITAEFPKNDYSAEGLLKLGDARMKNNKLEEARDKYSSLIANFPKCQFVLEAHFKLGSTLFNLNQPVEAAKEFDTAAEDKNSGDLRPEALYWSGVALEKADKKKEAIVRLARLVADFPNHTRVTTAKVRLAALRAVADQ